MSEEKLEKTQEEILRERAEVLALAGRKMSDALERLDSLGRSINKKIECIRLVEKNMSVEESFYNDLNSEIANFNEAREYAKLRQYYLIVTREAMGFRRHTWVEETYKIPPKKGEFSRCDESV
ncbi:MAG: hypothetical protein M0P57_03690 [Syntrophales bacterium]|jgi:hypothetical protein|nr:hypothetical protein [Syntrophales bacterium]MDY0044956.1 hypothetical protein [Syntrophales bacterium]